MATLIQIRRGTAAEWASINPILAAGELAFSTDLGKVKIGNGSSSWSSLSYITLLNTDELPEGSTNLYFSNARAINAVYSTITSSSAAVVSAANSYADTLDTDDIAEGSTNLYFTNQRALDATLSAIVSASVAAVSSASGYSNTQVANVVNSSPETLNTLNELAAAINDDVNFFNTITNNIVEKLSSSTASTIYINQNTASTTYLTQSDGLVIYATKTNNISQVTNNYTLVAGDLGKTIEVDAPSLKTLTVPSNASVPFDIGAEIRIVQLGTGGVDIVGDIGVVINVDGGDLKLQRQYSSGVLYKKNIDSWVLIQKTTPINQMYLRSANNTLYSITADNDGSLITTAL